MSRSGEWAPGIGFYIPVDYLALFFAGIYHSLRNKFNSPILIVIIAAILVHVGLQSRFALLMNFGIYMGAYMGSNKAQLNFRITSLLKFSLVAIILISFVSLSRDLATENSLAGEWGEYGDTFLPSVYYYLTNGIAGLNEYINIGLDETGMLYTFNPLIYLYSQFDSRVVVNIYETTTYYTPAPTIIATWLKFLIDDFGYIGTPILLYSYGCLLRYIEFKLRKKFSVFFISIYVHILAMFVLSFFSYGFFLTGFWYSLVISCILGFIIDSELSEILFGSMINKRRQ
jgi:oligosaccharide repeat unit polymerase